MALRPAVRAADRISTTDLRTSCSELRFAMLALMSALTASLSKITDAGQIRSSGVSCIGKGAGSETSAEVSWGLINDCDLIVTDCCDCQGPLVLPIGQEPEDT